MLTDVTVCHYVMLLGLDVAFGTRRDATAHVGRNFEQVTATLAPEAALHVHAPVLAPAVVHHALVDVCRRTQS